MYVNAYARHQIDLPLSLHFIKFHQYFSGSKRFKLCDGIANAAQMVLH